MQSGAERLLIVPNEPAELRKLLFTEGNRLRPSRVESLVGNLMDLQVRGYSCARIGCNLDEYATLGISSTGVYVSVRAAMVKLKSSGEAWVAWGVVKDAIWWSAGWTRG